MQDTALASSEQELHLSGQDFTGTLSNEQPAARADEEPTLEDHGGVHADETSQGEQRPNLIEPPNETGNEIEDDESSDSEEEEEIQETEPIMLGGSVDKSAFALVVGMEDANETDKNAISVPLTRLPATLGRSHDTKDKHFFGLGKRKALSRQQCVVYFQNAAGGRLGQFEENSDKLTYLQPPSNYNDTVIRPNKDEPLPASGFFVVESLGKNHMVVGGQRVNQGEVALLEHGTTIRVSGFSLYFLLPTNAIPVETIEVPKNEGREGNKRKASPANEPTKRVAKGSAGIVAELEALPVDVLLSRMSEAVESNQWERKHQMIGGAISLHAVKEAARAKPIRSLAKKDGGAGVARSDIMAWIREHPTYSSWVDQMLGKMEVKSYQSNVSKALAKAGYVRTGTTGRHVKWILPDVGISDEESSKDDESDKASQGDASDDQDEVAANNGGHSREEDDSQSEGPSAENEEERRVDEGDSSGSSNSDNDENCVHS